jgi:hypothetical protein
MTFMHRITGLVLALFLLGACQSLGEDLALLDLPDFQSVLFDLKCGEYTFLNFSTHEKCGGTQDAFGFVYSADKAVKLSLMPTEGDPARLYIPSFDIAFHSDYLKAGTILGKDQVRATCSRFQKEHGDDPTYYTVPAKTVTLKVVEYRGEQEHRILDDHTRWVFDWNIECPELDLAAKGKDQIDLSLAPIPARWDRANVGALPPAPSTSR